VRGPVRRIEQDQVAAAFGIGLGDHHATVPDPGCAPLGQRAPRDQMRISDLSPVDPVPVLAVGEHEPAVRPATPANWARTMLRSLLE